MLAGRSAPLTSWVGRSQASVGRPAQQSSSRAALASTSATSSPAGRAGSDGDLGGPSRVAAGVLVDGLAAGRPFEPADDAVAVAGEMGQDVADGPVGQLAGRPGLLVGEAVDAVEEGQVGASTAVDVLGRDAHGGHFYHRRPAEGRHSVGDRARPGRPPPLPLAGPAGRRGGPAGAGRRVRPVRGGGRPGRRGQDVRPPVEWGELRRRGRPLGDDARDRPGRHPAGLVGRPAAGRPGRPVRPADDAGDDVRGRPPADGGRRAPRRRTGRSSPSSPSVVRCSVPPSAWPR